MKQFDLNQNNKIDFAEFVLLMQSLPESDEALVEHAVNAQAPASATALQSVETQPSLASVNTQAQLLSIAISHSTVVAGAQNGLIFIWDLEASAPLFGSCATKLTQSHPGRLFEPRRRRLPRSANTRVFCQPLAVCVGIIRRRCLCLGGQRPRPHLPPSTSGARVISCLMEEPDLCSRWKLRRARARLEDIRVCRCAARAHRHSASRRKDVQEERSRHCLARQELACLVRTCLHLRKNNALRRLHRINVRFGGERSYVDVCTF